MRTSALRVNDSCERTGSVTARFPRGTAIASRRRRRAPDHPTAARGDGGIECLGDGLNALAAADSCVRSYPDNRTWRRLPIMSAMGQFETRSAP